MILGSDIDFGDGVSNRLSDGPGFFTPKATGAARLATGLTSDLTEGLWLISSTPDTDTGPPLVSVAVPTTTPMAAGTAVPPIGAAAPSKDPLLDSGTGKASSPSGLSGSPISAVPAKLPISASIPMLVQIPVETIGATPPSYVEPFDGDEPVKSPSSGPTIPGAGASPTFGIPTIGLVQPVQRAPAPARPITVAVPSAPVAPAVPAAPVAPAVPAVPAVSLVASVNFGRLVYLGPGGAALEAASSADTSRMKLTTTFLWGAHRHMLYRDADGTTRLFRNATTTPPSPSGNVEWYPLTEVIQTVDGGLVPEAKTTLVFGRPSARASDAAILAKLGQVGYKHVLDALGNEFAERAMWSVVGSSMWWACPEQRTPVQSAPAGSALVSTHPRAYKEPSDSCRVFAPDPTVLPVVTTVTAVTAVTTVATAGGVQPAAPPAAQPAAPPTPIPAAVSAVIAASAQQWPSQPVQQPVRPAAQTVALPAAPPTQPPAAQPAAQPSPLSPAFLATLLQSAQPVQPAQPAQPAQQPAQVQPAQPGGSVQTVALPAAPPTQIPADTLAATAGSTVAQPAQVQQPVSQQQPATQRQPALPVPETQLTVTATPQASSLGCTEFEGCLALASAGDILACGNALRAFGVCAGAAGAAAAAGAASVYQYSSGTGPLVPLRKLTSGALYGSDAERAYTVVPDTASPSRGKVLVSSLSSPSSVSSADSLDSVYPCALSGTVWAVAPVFPAEPQGVQVQYTRTDTTPATTKAPDLTVLWIVLGALGFALCLGALYAATRPRGHAGLAGLAGARAVVL